VDNNKIQYYDNFVGIRILGSVPSNRVTLSEFCIKLEISLKSLPIYHTFFALKNAHIQGLDDGVYFLVFYESNKYLKGTLFSLKMQYLNKQGQQASSKNLKRPDDTILTVNLTNVSGCGSGSVTKSS
jgi:hypothetical protein